MCLFSGVYFLVTDRLCAKRHRRRCDFTSAKRFCVCVRDRRLRLFFQSAFEIVVVVVVVVVIVLKKVSFVD
jgi:hypothetical protein